MQGGMGGTSERLSKSLGITGFMEPSELEWLADRAASHEVIVELGSYYGRSTRALADNTGGRVYAIDDWIGPRSDGRQYDSSQGQYETFVHNVSDLILCGKVIPVRCDHANAEIPETPDMVFIDGAHDPDSVRRDVGIWMGRIAKGGLLCGHDWLWPGMMETLWGIFGSVNVAERTQIWWIKA